MTMDEILQALAAPCDDPVPLLTDLVDCIRPRRVEDADSARLAVQALSFLLTSNEAYRVGLRGAIWSLLVERRSVSLFSESGIFPNNAFLSEAARRVSRSFFLPDVLDLTYLRDVLATLFHKVSDHEWVEAVGAQAWEDFLRALRFEEQEAEQGNSKVIEELCEALRVVSFRIAAMGLEPEVLRLDRSLEEFDSPFIALNVEMFAYVGQFETWWRDPASNKVDEKHLLVLLDQCHTVVDRIHARASRDGTSFSLTLQLRRLKQNFDRVEALVKILSSLHDDRSGVQAAPVMMNLACELIGAECQKNNISGYLRENIDIMALRVTENASHTGEHYITETSSEYWALFRSALGAGAIVALMAAVKAVMGKQDWTTLNSALAYCLDYGLGFVLIHMLHFTVATKQPAMTANAIAAAISDASGRSFDVEKLTTLIVRTFRSQTAATLGNILLAVPTAILVGWAVNRWTGVSLLSEKKALLLIKEVDVFSPGTLFYAAIAGVCLFLSGQIAGYYDNLCVYNQIPQRVVHLKWAVRLFGEARMQRVAHYVENNLGALAGNFFFGCLLGGAWAVGALLNLPIDIRHITFSSANMGYALTALDFNVSAHVVWSIVIGIASIGMVNLSVSFLLALFVALRARNIKFLKRKQLLKSVCRRLWHSPMDFLFPPSQPIEIKPEIAFEAPLAEKAEEEKDL